MLNFIPTPKVCKILLSQAALDAGILGSRYHPRENGHVVLFAGRCRALLFDSEECLQAHIENIHKAEEGRLTPAAYPRPETILLPSEKLNLLALSSLGQYLSVHVLQPCENHSVSVHTRYT